MRKPQTARHTASRVPVRQPEAVRLPRLWQNLPEDSRSQLARALAVLLWRMRPSGTRTRASRYAEPTR